MRTKSIIVVLVIPVLLFGLSLNDVLKASSELKTVSCHIRAENHSVRNKVSVVEFDFRFKRPGKMRIDYTYPKTMKGSFVAVDGKYFYNYVANLKKKMKKKITGKRNPGKDLGIFFDYVVGDLERAVRNMNVKFIGEETLKIASKEIKTYHFRFVKNDERQEIWFDSKNIFPVKLDIYLKGKLKAVFTVWNVRLNLEIDDGVFSPW